MSGGSFLGGREKSLLSDIVTLYVEATGDWR